MGLILLLLKTSAKPFQNAAGFVVGADDTCFDCWCIEMEVSLPKSRGEDCEKCFGLLETRTRASQASASYIFTVK